MTISRWVGACMLGALLGGTAHAANIVVVVNKDAPINQLSADEIRDIYMGETLFWGDVKIHPMGYRSKTKIQAAFREHALKISAENYKRHWIKRVFRTGGAPPKKIFSEETLISVLSQHPGKIGFIYSELLPKNSHNIKRVFEFSD